MKTLNQTPYQRRKCVEDAIKLVLLVLIPLPALIAWCHYKKLIKQFPLGESDFRVHEGGNDALRMGARECMKATYPILSCLCIGLYFIVYLQQSTLLQIIFFASLILSTVWLYAYSKHVGCQMVGVLFFPEKDEIVIPRDPLTNTAMQDLFHLKWIRDLYSMETLRLSDITKVNRSKGIHLFIHGLFGTRGLHFSNKQKRDECLAAIERTSHRRFSAIDFEGFA